MNKKSDDNAYVVVDMESKEKDIIDYSDEDAAIRIGQRIRDIREQKGMTQNELATKVGLDSARVMQYERGYRKPKRELLSKFASVLEVSIYSLIDPVTTNDIGSMYALFEIDKYSDFLVDYEYNYEDKENEIQLRFSESHPLYKYLSQWWRRKSLRKIRLKEVSSREEIEQINYDYKNWQWNFPNEENQILVGNDLEQMKADIKSQIEELQEKYEMLEHLINK